MSDGSEAYPSGTFNPYKKRVSTGPTPPNQPENRKPSTNPNREGASNPVFQPEKDPGHEGDTNRWLTPEATGIKVIKKGEE